MATSKEYADFIRDKFARLDIVTIRPMMGEYVIHMAGKVLGFIGDEQLLLEPRPYTTTSLSASPANQRNRKRKRISQNASLLQNTSRNKSEYLFTFSGSIYSFSLCLP